MKLHYSQTAINIKLIREMKRISKEETANALNIGTRQLQNLENGTSELSLEKLKKLSTLFDMPKEDIENYHLRPITNHIEQPQHNFIVVNQGTVHSSDKTEIDEMRNQIEELKSSLSNLRNENSGILNLLEDIRQTMSNNG